MSDEKKMHAINCRQDDANPHRVADIGYNQMGNPIIEFYCRRHRKIVFCGMGTMLKTWREMVQGDEQALQAQLLRLESAARELRMDLEDLKQPKIAG
jgi:hypothetical protein